MRFFTDKKKASGYYDSDKTDNLYKSSVLYQFLFSFDKSEKNFERSLFYRLFGIKKASLNLKLFKNNFAKSCEESVICNFFEKLCEKLAACSVRSYAVAFFYLGMYSLLVCGVNIALGADFVAKLPDIYISVLTVLFALLFMPFKSTFSKLVTKSRILSLIFFKLFFFDKEKFENSHEFYAHNGALILIGTLLGLSTVFLSVGTVLLSCFLFVSLLCVFKIPENGLVGVILLLPYLSKTHLCCAVTVVFIAYLYKLFRGKRIMKFKLFDVIVVLCAAIILCGGVAVSGEGFNFTTVIPNFVMVLLYFMFVNTTRNDSMTGKFNFAITLSMFLASVNLLYDKLYMMGHIERLQRQISFDFNITPSSIFENNTQIGEFVLLLAPFAISSIVISRAKNKKLVALISAALCLSLIALTASKGLILSFAVSVFVFITAISKKPFITAFAVCMCLVLLFAVPGLFYSGEFLVNPYRFDVYSANGEIISDYLLSGIGSSDDAYREILSNYMNNPLNVPTQSFNLYLQLLVRYGLFGFLFFAIFMIHFIRNILSAQSICNSRISRLFLISALCSVLSLLTRGLSDYVFTDYRIYAAFWIIVGLSCAVARYNRDDASAYEIRM